MRRVTFVVGRAWSPFAEDLRVTGAFGPWGDSATGGFWAVRGAGELPVAVSAKVRQFSKDFCPTLAGGGGFPVSAHPQTTAWHIKATATHCNFRITSPA